MGEQRIRREFRGQVGQQRARSLCLVFALKGKRQQDFREGRKIVPVLGRHFQLM